MVLQEAVVAILGALRKHISKLLSNFDISSRWYAKITKPNYFKIVTYYFIVTNLINALPGNSSVNTVQHATVEEAVFSVDPIDAPIDWLDNGHVTCVLYVRASCANGLAG
jgi:hypothetical protein